MGQAEKEHAREPVIRLGISTCLLGERVRYDGGHKLDRFLVQTLGQYVQWVPVCPEVEMGLPVPRESMRLEGDPEDPRLVASRSGTDHTEAMKAWAECRVNELAGAGLHGFVFKKTAAQPTKPRHRRLANIARRLPSVRPQLSASLQR